MGSSSNIASRLCLTAHRIHAPNTMGRQARPFALAYAQQCVAMWECPISVAYVCVHLCTNVLMLGLRFVYLPHQIARTSSSSAGAVPGGLSQLRRAYALCSTFFSATVKLSYLQQAAASTMKASDGQPVTVSRMSASGLNVPFSSNKNRWDPMCCADGCFKPCSMDVDHGHLVPMHCKVDG